MPVTEAIVDRARHEEEATCWIDRLSFIGNHDVLMTQKVAVFQSWEIEFRPGLKITYFDGCMGTAERPVHWAQKHLHFENFTWQYYVAAWGRRAGKTFAAAAEILFVMSLPNMRVWVVGPEYETTDRVFDLLWQALVVDEICGEVLKAEHRKDSRYIKLANGSWVKGKSAESKKGLKGEQLDLLVIDECAFISEEIYTEYLEPCLLDRLGRVMFISTPRGHNWFKKYYDRGRRKSDMEEGWLSSRFMSRDNPFMRKKWLESKKNKTPRDTYRREYEASFEEFEGRIYPMFRNRECDLKNPHLGGHLFNPETTTLPLELTYYRTTDIGHRHPTCSLIAGADKKGNVFLISEYYGNPSTLHKDHAINIRAMSGTLPIFDSVISHDAQRRYGTGENESENKSVLEIYEENGVFARLASTDVLPGIEIVRQYLQASIQTNSAHPRLYISRSCRFLRDELEHYIWAESRKKDQKDAPEVPRKKADHACDALRYLLASNPVWIPRSQQHNQLWRPQIDKDDDEWFFGDQFARSKFLKKQRQGSNRRRAKSRRNSGHGFRAAGMS